MRHSRALAALFWIEEHALVGKYSSYQGSQARAVFNWLPVQDRVQAARSSSPKSRWAALTPGPGEPKSRPCRRAQSERPRSACDSTRA
eukprot:2527905-Prymnesium_polylepis.1